MELRSARFDERDEVLDLLALWYGDRNFFARYNHNDPSFRDALCLVARIDGRLVGTAQIFDRRIRLCGRSFSAAGLGSVFVHPDYRGRGIGSSLLSLAVATMEREGFEVSLLFSDRIDFYQRFGWRSVPRTITILSPPKDGSFPDSPVANVVFRRFDAEADLARVSAIYDRYSGQFNTSIVRDLPYWRGNLVYAGNPEELFVVARSAELNSPLAAYARIIRYFELPMVMEYGYEPDARHIMVSLFEHLLALACGRARESFLACDPLASLLLPTNEGSAAAGLLTQTAHDPPLEADLRQRGFSLTYYADNNYMWRLVDSARVLKSLGFASERDFFAAVSSRNALFWTADRF